MLARCIYLVILVALVAATPAVAVDGTSEHFIWTGGHLRSYLLHAPRTLTPARPRPLLVAWHPLTSTAEAMEIYSGFSRLADREGFVVVYPQALLLPEMGGNSWTSITGELVHGNGAFIGDLISEVRKRHAIDPRRIFATGMSQGGAMTYYCAAHHSDVFAAIAPVVISLFESFDLAAEWPDRPIPVLMMNGTEDQIVPYAGGVGIKGIVFEPTPDLALALAHNNGCNPVPSTWALPDRVRADGCQITVTRYADGAQGSEVVLYTVHGGGHTWPGGRVWVPPFLLGPTCYDIDASRVIWDFLMSHPMPTGVVN